MGIFYLDPDDPPGIVRGQARDRTHFYIGTYRYVHPENLPIEKIEFDDFEITGLDGERLILHRCDQRPPVDYFFLEPTDPERIRRRSDLDR